jgi:hypothetical protein
MDCQIKSYGREQLLLMETAHSSRNVIKIEFGYAYYSCRPGDHSYDASMEMSV